MMIELALLVALAAATGPLPSGSPAPVALDRPFEVTLGERASVEGGLSVHFLSVVEDSRCPADVVCVWEGNARIVLELEAEGEVPGRRALDTNPGFTTEARFASFEVGLLSLEPYPLSESPMNEPYRATLTVSATSTTPTPAGAANASLLIYSGIPDPEWSLTRSDLDALAAIAAGLSIVEGTPPEGGLGYRGFRVTGPQGTWRANGGVVQTPDSAPGTSLSDPERLVERFLLASGTDAMTPDEAAVAAAAIDAAPSPDPDPGSSSPVVDGA
jgi:hypothetical protein